MGIASKVKFGFISTFVVAAVIVAGGAFLHDTRNSPGPDEDLYTFHAIFTPPNREKQLAITIDLNGVRYKQGKARHSPWNIMAILPKGSQVKLEVWQSEGGTLDCMIFRDSNGSVKSFTKSIVGPGGCVISTG